MDYRRAGVDIQKTDAFVEGLKKAIPPHPQVVGGLGGFGGLYRLKNGQYLVGSTDGVGTKVMLAQQLGAHSTIGIDLVAMCVNDLLCLGARPLFFLDYYATGKFSSEVAQEVLSGILEGCRQASIPLLGGETAEMPGMYPEGKYDLAGFVVGMAQEDELISGEKVAPGQSIVGAQSSGLHANGYSWARKLVGPEEKGLLEGLLAPTLIYSKLFERLKKEGPPIFGVAHITGGGFSNIDRINPNFDYQATPPPWEEMPPIFQRLKERFSAPLEKLCRVFNMGVGMVFICDQPKLLIEAIHREGLRAWELGRVCPRKP